MANISDPLDINVLSGGAGAVASNSVGQEFIPEVGGAAVLDKFQQKTMMLQLATDLSADAVGADQIHLPHVGVTPVKSVTQGQPVDFSDASNNLDTTSGGSMVSTETILSIDQHKVTSMYVPDALKAQTSYNLFSIYTDQMAYAISRAVDNYLMYKVCDNLSTLYGTATGVAFGATDGTVNVQNSLGTSGAVASLFEKCITETGSIDGWSLVLDPVLYSSIANLDGTIGFVRGNANAPAGANFLTTGTVGTLLGMPVILSNSPYFGVEDVAADADKGITAWQGFDNSTSGGTTGDDSTNDDALRGFAIHNSALYYASSQAPRVQQSYQHRHLADLMTVDAIYGCAIRNANTTADRRIIALIDEK